MISVDMAFTELKLGELVHENHPHHIFQVLTDHCLKLWLARRLIPSRNPSFILKQFIYCCFIISLFVVTEYEHRKVKMHICKCITK